MTVPIHHRDRIAGTYPQTLKSAREALDPIEKFRVAKAQIVPVANLLSRVLGRQSRKQVPNQQRKFVGRRRFGYVVFAHGYHVSASAVLTLYVERRASRRSKRMPMVRRTAVTFLTE